MAAMFGFCVEKLVTRDYLAARLEARFARQDIYIEQCLSGLDERLNVMAAILAIIAASVVPLAIGPFLSS